MPALSIQPPFPIFTDTDGQPLENGYVWIGTANLNPITNPITAYWDAALTVTAAQPVRTLNGYPVNAGTPARLYVNSDYSIQVQNKNGSVVYSAPAATERLSADLVTFIQAGTGAVARTSQAKMRESVSVFDFMTAAQITAVQSYAFGLDVTVPVQAAMDAAWTLRADVFIPSGGYLVTGLTLPGTYPTLDQRDRTIRVYGQGYGNPFANGNTGGTVLKSVTDAPILTDRSFTAPNAQGTYEIDHIRFDGTSTTPVVQFYGFYGTSSFYNNVIYQRGTGDGLKIIYGATGHIYENYAVNKDFVTVGLGASRTGIGFNFPLTYTSGLTTFSKNSSRGWLTGFQIGGGGASPISTRIVDCECSTVYNGIVVASTCDKTVIDSCYFEGGDGGVGIYDAGNYTVIRNNAIYPGFLKGIETSVTTNQGTLIDGNIISMGDVVGSTGVVVSANAAFSIGAKSVTNNAILVTAGTASCTGLSLSGSSSRITVTGNFFSSLPWTGSGSNAIVDTITGGARGYTTGVNGTQDFPKLNQGAISFSQPSAALTQADVTANTLTVPDGSYFLCSASSAATVLIFSTGNTSGRYVTFRTTTANMTFSNSAYIKTAGAASFTGPGTITFLIDKIGADNYGWEVSRTVF
jgi:hypothetical protein